MEYLELLSFCICSYSDHNVLYSRISLALHRAELHKNDLPKKLNSKSKKRHVENCNSLTGASSSSEDFSDVELSKKFKDDVKDETEDELFSSDDEFNGRF